MTKLTFSAADSTCAIILAAGKGTRMRSSLPKVLHPILGKPMLNHVIECLSRLKISKIGLVASEELYRQWTHSRSIDFVVEQQERKGTADALATAALAISDVNTTGYCKGRLLEGKKVDATHSLVVLGDCPAVPQDTLAAFMDSILDSKNRLGVLAMELDDPSGYGRLKIDESGLVRENVEEKDATSSERKITTCNSGIIFGETKFLFQLLEDINNDNSQGEYYLTDIFSLAWQKSMPAKAFCTKEYELFLGINDLSQLAYMQDLILRKKITNLMHRGTRFDMPMTCYLEDDVQIEPGATIGPFCRLLGKSYVKAQALLESHVTVKNSLIDKNVCVGSYSYIENATLTESCLPYSQSISDHKIKGP